LDGLKSKRSQLKDDRELRDNQEKIDEAERGIIKAKGSYEGYDKDLRTTKTISKNVNI